MFLKRSHLCLPTIYARSTGLTRHRPSIHYSQIGGCSTYIVFGLFEAAKGSIFKSNVDLRTKMSMNPSFYDQASFIRAREPSIWGWDQRKRFVAPVRKQLLNEILEEDNSMPEKTAIGTFLRLKPACASEQVQYKFAVKFNSHYSYIGSLSMLFQLGYCHCVCIPGNLICSK